MEATSFLDLLKVNSSSKVRENAMYAVDTEDLRDILKYIT